MINKYMNLIKEQNSKSTNQTFSIRTYGCQMNEHDSEYVKQMFLDMGFVEIEELEKADIIMINTCAIRETAEDKAFGYIGSLKALKRDYPNKKIIISGCMPKVESSLEEFKRAYQHLDILMGTNNYNKLPELLYKSYNSNKTIIDTEDYTDLGGEEINYLREYDHKSFVNITYGCNNFCTYCIVPYTRGRERSRPVDEIKTEVENLVSDGVKEITLLGQNVNSYGRYLKEKTTFVELLQVLDTIEDLERIRFMTSHPKDISDDLINAFGKLDKLMPHLHLPVQSGSNKVLKDMNRGYTSEEYLKKIKRIKEVKPDISISTDIIVGFPGEKESDFNDTLNLISQVKYDFIFSFIYSPRSGTEAAKRSDQIEYSIKQKRLEELNKMTNDIGERINTGLIGSIQTVLVDGEFKNNTGDLVGRTEGFKSIKFKGDRNLIGKIVKVKVESSNPFLLEGALYEKC